MSNLDMAFQRRDSFERLRLKIEQSMSYQRRK